MNDRTSAALPLASITAQPGDVRGLSENERDNLIITTTQVDGHWVILSRYGDDIWQIDGFPSNVSASTRQLNFGNLPKTFRVIMKALLYRYMRRGRRDAVRPKGASIRDLFSTATPFLRHLDMLGIEHLGAVTPMIAATYVVACKAHRIGSSSKPLSIETLRGRYSTVEAIYELSHYTDDQMPQHPWPDTSAASMAGGIGGITGGKTPLIPDDVFCKLFERADSLLGRGKKLLDLRDDLDSIEAKLKGLSDEGIILRKNRHLDAMGWEGGLRVFNRSLIDLRTACYIVLASTSGCRNHELANLQSGAHHRTEDDQGTVYHWMRSLSEKTDAGIHDWMIPEAAVRALRVIERWAGPYQAMIADEIIQRRRINTQDPQIAEANKHRHSLFLGVHPNTRHQVRTLTGNTWDKYIKTFAKDCGVSWRLASHQFRRKFANYAAHSRFGDLRYLKEHYAHWSMDMTLG